MKTTYYILSIVILCSCKGKSKPVLKDTASNVSISPSKLKKEGQTGQIRPYKLNKDFTIIDTGKYSNDGPMTGGSYAVIKKNDELTDTIDLDYGIKELGPQIYFYHKLNHEINPGEKDSRGFLALVDGSFILVANNNKASFSSLASNFDDYFSSPSVINQKIYFWKLEKIDTVGTLKVSATEFDPLTRQTKSHFLLNDVLETDDSGYFPSPYFEKDSIIFSLDEKKKWKFSTAFNL